jgi:uncharacterized protein (DUF2236 family)
MIPSAPSVPISQRLNGERVILLGWTRAILLQFAHPLVAAGVAAHSTFRASRLAPFERLRHTINAMRLVTYGDAETHARAIASIRAIHRRVRGELSETVGPFPAGTSYSADDPALLLWVHATLIESMIIVYDTCVRPLSRAERDQYCVEAAVSAIELGVNEDEVPRSWNALTQYLEAQYASGRIGIGRDARQLAARLLSPPFAWALWPAVAINRVLTIGWMPAHLRAPYGFRWNGWDRWSAARCARAVRAIRRLLPRRLALWPEYRKLLVASAEEGVARPAEDLSH